MFYFDTSGVAKLYHAEIGSAVVEGLLAKSPRVYLSRLGVLEMHSVLSGKVRTGALTQAAADKALQLFRSDVRRRRFHRAESPPLRTRGEVNRYARDNLRAAHTGFASDGRCVGSRARRGCERAGHVRQDDDSSGGLGTSPMYRPSEHLAHMQRRSNLHEPSAVYPIPVPSPDILRGVVDSGVSVYRAASAGDYGGDGARAESTGMSGCVRRNKWA